MLMMTQQMVSLSVPVLLPAYGLHLYKRRRSWLLPVGLHLKSFDLPSQERAYSCCLALFPGFGRKQWTTRVFWRYWPIPVSKEESSSIIVDDVDEEESTSKEITEELLSRPKENEELKALQVDSERRKLLHKLSEANQQNRFLKRQLHVQEVALLNFKSELVMVEFEIQALVTLAEEIRQSGIPKGSRQIDGKYIQSHLVSRLEVVREKLLEQIKDVEAAQSREVLVFWCGMAESVQVMGTFDGWSQGEHRSPEYDGSFTKFTTTLMLRPGRHEIKFLVDGEWQLSPEYPIVGEGQTKNNLLVVD